VFRRKGQKRHVPGALDLAAYQALMLGAGARLAARTDLSTVRDIPPQEVDLLVADLFNLTSDTARTASHALLDAIAATLPERAPRPSISRSFSP
jgi:hypothetical protein